MKSIKFPAKKPCWLIWCLMPSGQQILRAIDTTATMAKLHKKAIVNEGKADRIFIEKSELNHLYFGVFDMKGFKAAISSALSVAREEWKKKIKR